MPGNQEPAPRVAGRACSFRLAARRKAIDFFAPLLGANLQIETTSFGGPSSDQVPALAAGSGRLSRQTIVFRGSALHGSSCILLSHRMMTLMPNCF